MGRFFDREVRQCPGREAKINWDSIRMKTIPFSRNRKYILISVGFDSVLAELQGVSINKHSWVRCQHQVLAGLHLVAGLAISPPHHRADRRRGLGRDWLVAAVDWVISSSQHHSGAHQSVLSVSHRTGVHTTPGLTATELTRYHHYKD